MCLILVWYGPRPEYFPYFLESCRRNKEITWKIITEDVPPGTPPANVQYIKMDQQNLEKLVEKKTGARVSLENPHKICDLKPAFGELFGEYLDSFEFWGYSDMDVIWGNISRSITGPILDETDVLSCYPGFLSGPMTLYRNIPVVNSLYRDCPDYPDIFKNARYLGFDENIQRNEIRGVNMKKLRFWFEFVCNAHWKTGWKKDLRYQYQWFVKKKTMRAEGPVDMTEIVWMAADQGNLRARFLPLLISDPYFTRRKQKTWGYALRGVELRDQKLGNEIIGFHFQLSKSSPDFRIMSGYRNQQTILINETGIRYEG